MASINKMCNCINRSVTKGARWGVEGIGDNTVKFVAVGKGAVKKTKPYIVSRVVKRKRPKVGLKGWKEGTMGWWGNGLTK
jgi:hypothetical protein